FAVRVTAAGKIARQRSQEKLAGRDVQLRAAVDIVQADVFVLVAGAMQLRAADQEIAGLALRVRRQWQDARLRGRCGALALPEARVGLRHRWGNGAAVAVDRKLGRPAGEALRSGQNGDLLQFKCPIGCDLPVRMRKVLERTRRVKRRCLSRFELKLSQLGYVPSEFDFQMKLRLRLGLLV